MSELSNILNNMEVQYVPMSQLCDIRTRSSDYFLPSEMVGEHEGAVIISPHNILNNSINYDKVTYYSLKGYYERPNIQVEVGDIVMCKYAAEGTDYKSAVVESLPEPAITPTSVNLIKNINCNPKYLQLIISSKEFQTQLWKHRTSGPLNNVKISEIYKITIPMIPLDKQEIVANVLCEYRDKNNELISKLAKEIEDRNNAFNYYLNQSLWNIK